MDWLGVDVGGEVLAVDSDFSIYASAGERYRKQTKEIRRHDVIASIRAAKAIAQKAKESGRGIALENLSFPPRTNRKRRRIWLHTHNKIAFYANKMDVPLKYVNPAYTSQTCPNCNCCCRENRPRRNRFKCTSCGFAEHADVVGARNIRRVAEGTFSRKVVDTAT